MPLAPPVITADLPVRLKVRVGQPSKARRSDLA
jgi:hypothetical protein